MPYLNTADPDWHECTMRHRFHRDHVQVPNYCPVCGVIVATLAEDSIRQWIAANYPGFERVLIATTEDYVLRCKECKTEFSVKSMERLGLSYNTYVTAILRRTIEKHVLDCDGTVKVRVRPGKQVVRQPSRKIRVE